jgi:hypothetical protein
VPDDLGGRLLAATLVSAQQVAEAARSRMPLAPALVEGGLDEFILESFLRGEGYQSDDALNPTNDALARLPSGVAQRLWALPLRMEEEGLVVAMADPSDAHTTRELSLISGALLVPRVALVSELRAALDRAYPDYVPSPDDDEPDITFELTRPRTPASGLNRDATPPDEDDFVPLLRPKGNGSAATNPVSDAPVTATRRFTKPPGVEGPRISQPPGPPDSDPPPASTSLSDPEVIVDTFTNSRVSLPSVSEAWNSNPPPRRAHQGSIEIEISDSWDDLDAPVVEIKRPSDAPIALTTPRSPRRSYTHKPVRVPGDIGTTLAQMRTLRDRDAVLTMGCEAALLVSRAAVFLALRGQVLRGWSGLGGSLTADAVRNLWIPLSTPSMFRAVVAEGTTYAGPYGATAADNLFRAATGSRGGVVVVCPVEVMGKTVAVLVADDVRFGEDGRERIETLSQSVGDALKRIILARKG